MGSYEEQHFDASGRPVGRTEGQATSGAENAEIYAMHERLDAVRRGEDPFANAYERTRQDLKMLRVQEAIRHGGDVAAAMENRPGWDAAWNPGRYAGE
jgi:hypothetical protein